MAGKRKTIASIIEDRIYAIITEEFDGMIRDAIHKHIEKEDYAKQVEAAARDVFEFVGLAPIQRKKKSKEEETPTTPAPVVETLNVFEEPEPAKVEPEIKSEPEIEPEAEPEPEPELNLDECMNDFLNSIK